MGVDGQDERRGGAAGNEGAPPRQIPGQTGPLGATPAVVGPVERHDRADAADAAGPSVPAQRERIDAHSELPLSDGDLIDAMRAGDDGAYEEMYRRHAEAVRRYARGCCRDAHTAEDLTGEVFARTLQAVRGGAGPDSAVRAYLLTTVRRVAAAWAKTAKREQLVEDFAVFAVSAAGSSLDGDNLDLGADVRAMQEAEQSMAVRAFRSLPERYQTVLWHTTIEDESPSEVAPLLGLTANATAVLAHRAREGLKQAYLQAHVSRSLTAGGDCARYADRLGAYARGGLRMRAERGLRKHLDACARCRTAALEVADVNQRIGAVLPVAVIGWFATGYALKAAVAAAGVVGAAAGTGAAAAASGGGSGAAGSTGGALGEGLGTPVKFGIGAGVVVAAGAALALALSGAPRPPRRRGPSRTGPPRPHRNCPPRAPAETHPATAITARAGRRAEAEAHPGADAATGPVEATVPQPGTAVGTAAQPRSHADTHSHAHADTTGPGPVPHQRAGLRLHRRRQPAGGARGRERLAVAAEGAAYRRHGVPARRERARAVLGGHRPQPAVRRVRRRRRRRRPRPGAGGAALLGLRGRGAAVALRCGARRAACGAGACAAGGP